MSGSRALWSVFMVSVLWCADGAPSAQAQAGARMAFDVASVKPDVSDAPATSRFPLGPGDGYAPGGFFSATNQPLIVYLRFAYKFGQADLPDLPAWVYNERFDIEARAQESPTKDQMRLMMQSLLSDRFKLTMHTQRQIKPVFNLVVAKAGRTGPRLQAHSENQSCSTASTSSSISSLQLPPIACGSIGPVPASEPGRGRLVGRSVTIGRIAGFLMNPFTGVDRPVLDRTGLTGTFDFSLEWSLAPDSAQPFGSQSEDTGPTFLEALQQQLGLRLKSTKGPVDVVVIDHVEHPTEN
jgi:uncharacterized protein (TIGR03435 family)